MAAYRFRSHFQLPSTMDTGDTASQPPPPGSNEIWNWIPSASVGYPDEAKALTESELACDDSPSEARRDQQITALRHALKEAPNIKALLGTESSANGLPSQRPAAMAANGNPTDSSSLLAQLLLMQANGQHDDLLTSFGDIGAPNASGWRRPKMQAPVTTAAAAAAADPATAAAAAPTTTVRRRLFGKARICENLDCNADSSKGWEVNGARSPPTAPRGYPPPCLAPPLDLGWLALNPGGFDLTPNVDSLDTSISAWLKGLEAAAAQQQQQKQKREQRRDFASWKRAALALAMASEHNVYDMCEGETVRAVISLKAAQREPLAITCVLEHSEEALPLAKQTCHFLIDLLLDDDYLGIISYASGGTALPLTRMTAENRTLAHVMVDVMVGGGRNQAPHAGVTAALWQQSRAAILLERCNLVHGHILFRLTNLRDTGAVRPTAPAPVSAPIIVHIMSMGMDDRLDVVHPGEQALGDGAIYHIRTETELAEGPGNALRRLLSLVAKDVHITVTPVEGVNFTAFRLGDRTGAVSAATAGTGTTAATGSAAATAIGSSGAVGSAGPASSSSAPVNIPTARPPLAAKSIVLSDMCAEDSREVLLELRLPHMGGGGSSKAAVMCNPTQLSAAGPVYGMEPSSEGREEMADVASVVLEYMDVCSGRPRRESAVLRVRRRTGGRSEGRLPAEVALVRPVAPAAPAGMGTVALSYLYRRL